MAIHRSAVIDHNAEIGTYNEIGPLVVIEGGVRIGNNNRIEPGAIITSNTTIGDNNRIHGHVYIGNEPQDLAYDGSETYVKIGNDNVFREFTTVHRGTKEGSSTVIGDNNYLMTASHVAHNCRIGNNVIMVNGASLGGYAEVHDHAFLSAFVIVHQFCRIGGYTICGILTKITKDVPPFLMIDGNPALVRGLNLVGLKRKGFDAKRRAIIKQAFKTVYRMGYSVPHALELLGEMEQQSEDLRMFIDFIVESERGILLKTPVSDGS
ncbi:MAG: acyl-ACP--UDP-N-acetylglucosamine O-acyltransferase [Spirochaetes bacterium]|nr:acyl-ACP--UDP-N-acetylglucosamine O-acyltransferase [Spirochaetota bacterium]